MKFTSCGNQHFFTISCHHQNYQLYQQSQQKLDTVLENKVVKTSKITLKIRILRSLRILSIILVGLTMTWKSEKIMISTKWYVVFWPTHTKKSWTVYNLRDSSDYDFIPMPNASEITVLRPILWKLAHKIELATQLKTRKMLSATPMQVNYSYNRLEPVCCKKWQKSPKRETNLVVHIHNL